MVMSRMNNVLFWVTGLQNPEHGRDRMKEDG